MVCIVNRKHRLSKNKTITITDLRNEAVVAINYSSPLGGAILEIFVNSGETIVPRVEAQHTTTACALVENEVGVAIVDPFVINSVQRPELLSVKPFTPATTATVYAIWSKSKPLSRMTEAFLREVKSGFDGSSLFRAEQAALTLRH
jgi:DNA-binding transcriptional LysR family regulator